MYKKITYSFSISIYYIIIVRYILRDLRRRESKNIFENKKKKKMPKATTMSLITQLRSLGKRIVLRKNHLFELNTRVLSNNM